MPSKNTQESLTEKAKAVAQAIVDEDSGAYLVALRDSDMDSMGRSEVIEFRDLVHRFADTLERTKQIKVVYHS